MIDCTHQLLVRLQCQLLKLVRSIAYYQPTPVSETALALMWRIDELHMAYPFAGARILRDLLRQEGYAIGRRHVATLMRRMGIEAVYRKPRISHRHSVDQVYPYLLRDLAISRPNHVWTADIHLHSNGAWLRVLVCRPGLGQSSGVGVAALRHAHHRFLSGRGARRRGPLRPARGFNADRGCPFTSQEFTRLLTHHGVKITWTGKVAGATTCLWNDSGKASNTMRCICTPTTPSGLHTRAWSAI